MKVATDALTGYNWHFETDDSGKDWYVQKEGQDEVSRLSLKNFPNPNDVWEKKIRKSEGVIARQLTQEERDRLKPRQYIFEIWSDREERIS